MKNPLDSESELIRLLFNLEEMIEFQKEHEITVTRGADWQFECWIDGKCHDVSLTPLGALTLGVIKFKQENVKNKPHKG